MAVESALDQLHSASKPPDYLLAPLGDNQIAKALLEKAWATKQTRAHIVAYSAALSFPEVWEASSKINANGWLPVLALVAAYHDLGKGDEEVASVIEIPRRLSLPERDILEKHPGIGAEAMGTGRLAIRDQYTRLLTLAADYHHFSPVSARAGYGGSAEEYAKLDNRTRNFIRITAIFDRVMGSVELTRDYRLEPVEEPKILGEIYHQLGPLTMEELHLARVLYACRENIGRPAWALEGIVTFEMPRVLASSQR